MTPRKRARTGDSVPSNNRSFVLQERLKVSYEDRAAPQLKSEHDVIIEVKWTGICGSDVHYWQEGKIGSFVLKAPMTLGHESAGIVHSVGSSVTSLSPGDRVAMEPGIPCRRCAPCKSGSYNLCPEMAFAATPPYDGTLCRFYSLPSDFCYKLAPQVSLEAGALVEPTAVAVHIVRQGGVSAGHSVVVFGAGPVGLLCAAVAKAFGAAKVVLADINEKRLEFARGWVPGGCETFVSRKESAQETAARMKRECGLGEGPNSGGDGDKEGGGDSGLGGAHVVLEASGAAPCAQAAVWVCRPGGTYVQAGMGGDDIHFPIMGVCAREITVKGSFRYKQGDYATAVGLLERKAFDAEKLISKKVGFEEAEKAFGLTQKGEGIKILIEGPK